MTTQLRPGHVSPLRKVPATIPRPEYVGKKSPRDAIGASVFLTTGKTRQRQDVISGGSYASQNDQTLHFGLGESIKVDKLEIKWPDGSVETISVPGVDRKLTIVEGKGVAK